MRRAVQLSVRFVSIVAAITLMAVFLGSPRSPGGPYGSALSAAVSGPAFAATHCENRACATDPVTLKFICVKSTGTSCAAYNSKGPVASKCIEDPC
jgi:hypothetical protein